MNGPGILQHCGRVHPADAKRCMMCGARLADVQATTATPQLRVATVLFSDLTGYTRMATLCGAEPTRDVMTRVKTMADTIIGSHGGVVNQFSGDGIMSLFGHAVGNEDDPASCARAVLELHEAVKAYSTNEVEPGLGVSVSLHSGFATGIILLQRGKVDLRDGTYPAIGGAVNLAARLGALALPGEILCCNDSAARMRGLVECEPMAPREFRGLEGEIVYWRVQRWSRVNRVPWHQSPKTYRTPFTGRVEELEMLQAQLAKATSGQGQGVVIVGEAGIGKSRLVGQFRDMNHHDDRLLLSLAGNCRAYGPAPAYAPVLEILRHALGLDVELPIDESRERAVNGLLKIDRALERYIPHLLDVLDLGSDRYALDKRLPGEVLRAELELGLVWSLIGLSRVQPVLLVFEDWHWADDASRGFLDRLLEEIHCHPILLLVLARPSLTPDWPQSPNLSFLSLDPLSRSDTQSMVHAVIEAHTPPTGLVDIVFDRTDGNPLFIEELTQALKESGAVLFEYGRAVLNLSLDDLVLPLSVQAAIQSRLDRLSPLTGDVLRAASVIGRRFDIELLAELTASASHLDAALAELLQRDLIHREADLPQPRYLFKHAVTHEVTYASIPLSRRRDLHRRAARAIETIHASRRFEFVDHLALHYRHAGIVERAVHYLCEAARRANQLFMVPEAIAHYRTAMEVLDEARVLTDQQKLERIDISLEAGRLTSIYATPKVYEALLRSRDLARDLGDQERLAKVLNLLGATSWLNSRFSDAVTHLEECLAVTHASGLDSVAAFAHANLGQTYFYGADFARGMAHLDQALKIARARGHIPAQTTSLNFLGLHYTFTGRFVEAGELQDVILQEALARRERKMEQVVRLWIATRMSLQGEWTTALRMFDATVEVADIKVARYIEGYARCGRAFAAFMARPVGNDALQNYEDGLNLLVGMRHRLAMSLYHAMFAEMLAMQRQSARAAEQARAALSYARFGEHYGGVQAHRAKAVAAALRSLPDLTEAAAEIEHSIQLAAERQQRPDEAIGRLRFSEIHAMRGDVPAALVQLDEARSMFRDMHMGWWMDVAQRVRRQISGGFRSQGFVPYSLGVQ